MSRIYLLVGTLALAFFSYAQHQGMGLFDDTSSTAHSRGSSGRTSFHK